jgi:Cof subfamily protein (haloacid dehalogenase superfamily)
MYDLIIADIDGTLLDSNGHLSESVIQSVRKAHREGVGFTIASGRNKRGIEGVLERLGIILPYISSNGACIVRPNGHIIKCTPLSEEDVKTVVALAYEAGNVGVIIENNDMIICDPKSYNVVYKYFEHSIVVCENNLLAKEIPKVIKISLIGESEVLKQLRYNIEQCIQSVSITGENTYCMEIAAQGVNKGAGVKYLSTLLDIPLSRIAVVGDGFNDIPMFEVAGMSIAMGNAPIEVKQRACCVAPANDCDGAGWAIREILVRNKMHAQ